MRVRTLVAAAVVCSASVAARADVTNDTFTGTFDTPTSTTVLVDLGSFTAPGGGSDAPLFLYQITGTQVTITDINSNGLLNGPFTGFNFTDTSNDETITGLTLDPSSNPVFDAGVASFTGDTISLNLAGLPVQSGDVAVYDLTSVPSARTTAVTPEPSSVLLLGTGLLGMAGVLRRRLV